MTKIRSDFIGKSFNPHYDLIIGSSTEVTRNIADYTIDTLSDTEAVANSRILFLDGTHVRSSSALTLSNNGLVIRMQSKAASITLTTYGLTLSGENVDAELNVTGGTPTFSGSAYVNKVDDNVSITGTLDATANVALYSDLAEKYTIKGYIQSGLIVSKNKEEGEELKITENDLCPDVFGVITNKPAFLMNSNSEGYGIVMIGRSPIIVNGPVKKWDYIVPAGNGIGRVMNDESERPFVIGSALESINTSVECEVECFIKVRR